MSRSKPNNLSRKSGTSRSDSRAIRALTSSGGWIAQSLKSSGYDTSSERWDGRSGYEKAISFGLKILEIIPSTDIERRSNVSKYVDMCTGALFKKTVATDYERSGRNSIRQYTNAETGITNSTPTSNEGRYKRLAAISIIDWGRYVTTPSINPEYTLHLEHLSNSGQQFLEGMAGHFNIDTDTQNTLLLSARAEVHEIWSNQNPANFKPTYPPVA